MAKSFRDLTEREILALAISLEEEHARTYADIAESLGKDYPGSAELFRQMAEEEKGHGRRLGDLYRGKFGEHIPLIRRGDVKGFVARKPAWLIRSYPVERLRKMAASMEAETRQFYLRAAERATDLSIRQLLADLAEEERVHVTAADVLEKKHVTEDVRRKEEMTQRRLFLLQVVQPGLVGLMDGSVSTLAPLFAAAFVAYGEHLKHGIAYDHFAPFRIGLAASIGAGISMGFAEALSDDGSLTGRGRPLIRGVVCGLMTTAGGIGHTLPYLIPDFQTATAAAFIVVAVELAAISWIRHRYMEAPWVVAAIQVVIGGIIVLLAGIFIGGG